MIDFPCCKINLGLRIGNKRQDGFHNLQTIFYPVPFFDALEIASANSTSIKLYGNELEGNTNDNLCLKAYRLMKEKYNLPYVKISLIKNIPSGAGLGGGSSNAAFTIKMLNKLFKLDLQIPEMEKLAAETGSDSAFFIQCKPTVASGRGEIFSHSKINLAGDTIVMVFPEIKINTAEAFQWYDSWATKNKMVHQPIEFMEPKEKSTWNTFLKNDFEGVVFERYNELAIIKSNLYKTGAYYASMSGSGSVIFGLFDHAAINETELSQLLKKEKYRTIKLD